jgi:hypothetical protein
MSKRVPYRHIPEVRLRSWRIRSLVSVLLFALPACGGGAGRTVAPGGSPTPAAGPAEVVERFMRMVSSRSYLQMGYLFGTREGAITSRDPEQQVERRMYAIASILHNERYVIQGEQSIPGRGADVSQLTVQITQQGKTTNVPFVVVRAATGGWLVEQVDLQAVTRQQ